MDGTVLAPNNSITILMTVSAHQFRIESKEQKYLNSIVLGCFFFFKEKSHKNLEFYFFNLCLKHGKVLLTKKKGVTSQVFQRVRVA